MGVPRSRRRYELNVISVDSHHRAPPIRTIATVAFEYPASASTAAHTNTRVPYQEDPSQGKDRPLLVIARHGSDRAYALRLTSASHDGERDYLAIGAGAWDSRGRASWVDIDQLYSVHNDGLRREAAALDPDTFQRVASVLVRRYGWTASM